MGKTTINLDIEVQRTLDPTIYTISLFGERTPIPRNRLKVFLKSIHKKTQKEIDDLFDTLDRARSKDNLTRALKTYEKAKKEVDRLSAIVEGNNEHPIGLLDHS